MSAQGGRSRKQKLPLAQKKVLAKLTSVFRRAEGFVGGGHGIHGIDGTLRSKDMARTFHLANQHCNVGSADVLLDVGCSLCRPGFVALAVLDVSVVHGIEVDEVKVEKARRFIQFVCQNVDSLSTCQGRFKIRHADINKVMALSPPPTLIYTFWEGWSPADKAAVARLFNTYRHSIKGMITISHVVVDVERVMEAYGFMGLKLKAMRKNCSQSGSSAKYCAYVFSTSTIMVANKEEAQEVHRSARDEWTYVYNSDHAASVQRVLRYLAADRKKRKAEDDRIQELQILLKQYEDQEQQEGGAQPPTTRARGRPSRLCAALGGSSGGHASKKVKLQHELHALIAKRPQPEDMADKAREEEFKEVPFAPAYEVNGNGSIRLKETGKVLDLMPRASCLDGHAYVRLKLPQPLNKHVMRPVRNLVALAWLPNASKEELGLDDKGGQKRGASIGKRVWHLDGDPYNNRMTNLVLVNPISRSI
ncbi:hypothetical protein VaNZ11_010968 [Volvox africanus]|uniref:Uncharacterized protein n=1 Tax=Volvox africanus TaxID=51714 RepID=A0ABQ5SBW9_9CHLO|nr:hypothetical protein VaNZ11_010968 [Volvox africanus]